MKRPMTLTGSILAIVANGLISVLFAIGLVAIFEVIGGATGSITVLVVALLELAVFVLGLIFSILALCKWSKNPAEYKKGHAITAVVFNFVGAIICLISASALYIVSALLLIAAAVLLIVDLCLEGKRASKVQAPSAE